MEEFMAEQTQKLMGEASVSSFEPEGINQAELFEAIAKRVRNDSKDKACLTSPRMIAPLKEEPGTIRSRLFAMGSLEAFRDIKFIVRVDGTILLYSDSYLSRKDAEKLAMGEEVREQIAVAVRFDSGKKVRLTAVDALGMLIPGAEPDKVEGHLLFLLDDERYRDLCLITNSKGTRFLYSKESMSATYAGVLARAEANDPRAAIAATVREESRLYPRPTNLSVFAAPVFKINALELETYAEQVVSRPEYKDIKLVRASTGAIYLYSDTYLHPDLARATAEWEEVGRYQNP